MVNGQSVVAMNAPNGQLRCAQCEAVFSHVSNLIRHGHIHSGAFKCIRNGCEKTFCERKQLSKHLNRHSSTNLQVRIVPFNIRIKVEVKKEPSDDFVGGGSSQQSVQHWKRVKKEEEEDELKVKIEVKHEHGQTGDGDGDNGQTVGGCEKEEDDESYCGCDDCLGETEQNVNVPIETSTLFSTVQCSNDNECEDDRIDELDETVEDVGNDENEGGLLTSGQIDDDEMDVNDDRDDKDTEVEKESENYVGEIDVIEHRHVAKRCKTMVIQQEERYSTIKTGEESIATTNPTQSNLAQSNRHLQCPLCPKSFDRNSHLPQHVRVHTGERPFHCGQCDKSFNTKSNLTKHQLIHQNIKQFSCPECEIQFTHKHHLLAHLLIHSEGRPFECRHCEKSFTQLITRNRHEQAIHLHVKPYRCKQCGHTATGRSDVIRHIRMVHFGLPKTTKRQQTLNIIDDRDPRKFIEKV